jgi:hypothetical protein
MAGEKDFKNKAIGSLSLIADRVIYKFAAKCTQEQIEAIEVGEKDEELERKFSEALNNCYPSSDEIVEKSEKKRTKTVSPLDTKNGHSC